MKFDLKNGEHAIPRVPGLTLRVAGRNRSFILRYTAETGRRREMGLGACRARTLTEYLRERTMAIDLAVDAREALLRGVDPIDARKQRKADLQKSLAAVRECTILWAARRFHERMVDLNKWSDRYQRQWIFRFEADCPDWVKALPVSELDAHDVIALTAELPLGEKRINDLRQRLSKVQAWLVQHRYVDKNGAAVTANVRPKSAALLDEVGSPRFVRRRTVSTQVSDEVSKP